ncbi:MAG TPA: hypothetical protein VG826_15370 [Pirellulales bacterium]|nr:hypothetical protein [Pirellulales bacterium]
MEWLIFFLVAGAVTLVGHGIWVLLAAICRLLFGLSERPAASVRCRHCGRAGRLDDGTCRWCGQSLWSVPADEQADLSAVTRQLQRWQSRGALKPGTVGRLLSRVDAYRRSLTAPTNAPKVVEAVEPLLAEIIEPAQPAVRAPSSPSVPLPPTSTLPRRTAPALAPQMPGSPLPGALAPVAPAPATASPLHAAAQPAAAIVAQPRRSLSEIMSTFMEERNIRWGELVGGLLIVGSSVALVISIWEQLKTIPYFQFFIFVAVSAALFGIGLYTEHRWKLTSTSHGVLIIANLLVPLNFVAMVATRRAGFDPRALVTELAALAVFVALVYRSGRVLVDRWAWRLTGAVVASSGMLLLLIGRPSLAWSLGVAAMATALEATCVGSVWLSLRREERLSADFVTRLFILTGITSFALAVALGMAAVWCVDRSAAVHALAPLLTLAATPVVLCGLAVMKGLSTTNEQPGLRTAGTAVALASVTVMLAGLGLAWPMPLGLVAASVFNFAALATIGLQYRMRPFHLVAAGCLAVGYVVGCHVAAGNIAIGQHTGSGLTLLRLFVDGETGLWLVGFVALTGVVAEGLTRWKRGTEGIYYLAAGAVAAGISLTLVTWPVIISGGEEAARAAVAYAVLGLGGLAANLRLRRIAISHAAGALIYGAALFATTAWLVDQPWVDHDWKQLFTRHGLQCYAAAWGALSLVWVLARVGLRSRSPTGEFGPPLDRLFLRFTIVGSLVLAIWQATPGVIAEIAGGAAAPGAPDTTEGWILLAVATCALAAALWDEWHDSDVAVGVLLSLNAAVLAAIPASAFWATASALRWNLAGVFVGSAAVLGVRQRLGSIFRRLGCRIHTEAKAPSVARAFWLIGAALPVVACSATVALMQIGGHPAAGPLAGSWFARIGTEISQLLPLACVTLGLTAYAVRELSPGYAFGAGLVANLTVVGGHALMVPRFGALEAVRLAQLATIVSAAWAIGWLACRGRLLRQAAREPSPRAGLLLRLQTAQSALGNLWLVATASAALFIIGSPQLPGPVNNWVAAVGSPWGWLALVIGCAAGINRARHFGERFRPDLVGLLGMAALSLMASSVEYFAPHTPWPYRALMLGWAMYAFSVVAATWWAAGAYAPAGSDGPPAMLVRAVALWVRIAGLLAVAMGLKTVLVEGISDSQTLWAASAIGIASAACAAMAVWLRREGWAFVAGLGVNLAASLAVSHLALRPPHDGGAWILLWQANVMAGAIVALLWLAARRRIYAGGRLSPLASPLLTLQVGLAAVAALGLIAIPLGFLLGLPGTSLSPRFVASAGWFAWILPGAATGIYFYHVARHAVANVLAVFMLGAGVLLAAVRLPVDAAAAYQTLVTVWLAAGFLLLAGGWLADRRSIGGDWLRSLLPKHGLEPWIAIVPLLVAAIAVRGTLYDAQWGRHLGLILFAAAILADVLAIWLRKPHHLYAGALVTNLAASLVWYARPEPLWADLLLTNALAAAATSVFWSLWAMIAGPIASPDEREPLPPLEDVAAVVALSLVSFVAAWSWLATVVVEAPAMSPRLTWLAWSATAVSSLVLVLGRRSRLGTCGLYASGLTVIVLTLIERGWQGDQLVWASTLGLAGHVCIAAVVAAMSRPIGERLRLPSTRGEWFSSVQATLTMTAAGLGIWAGLYFELPRDRIASPITSGVLLAASAAMLRRVDGFWSNLWRVTALLFLALMPAELGWTFVTGDDPRLIWIHRETILLVSFAAAVGGCELLASRWIVRNSRWLGSIVRFLPLAIGLVVVLTGVVLVQEIDYGRTIELAADGMRPGVPMWPAAKGSMVVVLVELIALALRYAMMDQRDPLRLSPRGRAAYVYAAEVLALLICLHVRVTMPQLIPFGIVENWWTLVVMIVAFCGAGLSEFFSRRRLDVLSEPLRRTALAAPLLPVLALGLYLVWRPTDVAAWVFRARLVDDEAVFFLIAVFYGLQGWMRRSLAFWAFSGLAANAGFWLLWHRLHLDFLVHPQLWLIPPALAVLVAAHLNRDRLSRQQTDAVRHLALSMIYVSSTADVFISHVGRQISLPLVLVLMGLSVTGILAGMLLRVRSFVYLGFTFLLVDVSIMIYHAAWDLGHTWVFWATGIVVGAAIIGLFAVFEKRRNEAAKQVGSGR